MVIPINLRTKRASHKTLSYAQDLIVQRMYDFFPNAVLHGGTAIWRCYQGARFSEDIDVYLETLEGANGFFDALAKQGFTITKKRIKDNSIYSAMEFNRETVRFEAVFKKIDNRILKEYETSEGLFISVYTLSAEDLVKEKVAAYLKRKKIRDLYDIYFLLRYIKDKVELDFDKLAQVKPIDEEHLKVLIMSGPIPSVQDMLNYIKKWEK